MILTLFNFRCYYGKHIFNIDDSNITLIVGESGKGKTSILMSLYFVITGISSSPKIISDGCNSCYVELESQTQQGMLKIHRSKKPNRVTVDIYNSSNEIIQSFQEQEAQNQINIHFGKFFDITSYVQQQYQKTFLYQSPADKLEILEKLCFSSENDSFIPEKLKQLCSNEYKKITNEINTVKGQYQVYHSINSKIIEQPITIQNVDEEVIISKINRIKHIEKQIDILYKNQNIEKNIKDITLQLQNIENKLQNNNYDYNTLEEQLFFIKQLNDIPQQTSFEKYSKEECIEMFEEYNTDIKTKQEYLELQNKIQDRDINHNKLIQLKNELQEIQNTSEGIYNCPSCNTFLSLENPYGLRIIKNKKSNIIDSKIKEQNIKKIQTEIDKITKIINIQDEYLNQLQQLEEIVSDDSLETLKKEFSGLQKYYDENCLLEKQSQQREKIIQKITINLSIREIEEILTLIREHKHLNYYLEKLEKSLISNEEITNCEILLNEKELLIQQVEKLKQQKNDYDIYLLKNKEYNHYLENKSKLQECIRKITELENKLYSITELKKIILKTESDIIQQKTKHISDLVNVYISEMFNEPIEIKLYTTKKTNTNNEKFQIQLEVIYKNMKCDVGILSGGEQSRLNLAFICAFAHVFNSPLLLLDECTSNLDQNLTECVLEQISKVGIPKIIIIAHQIVEGNFKQIIRL